MSETCIPPEVSREETEVVVAVCSFHVAISRNVTQRPKAEVFCHIKGGLSSEAEVQSKLV